MLSLKRSRLFARFLAALFVIAAPFTLRGDSPSPSSIPPAQLPSQIKYRLIDLGETEIDPDSLSRQPGAPALAPIINNEGQIIGNRIKGGFLYDSCVGEWAPYVNDVIIYFHDLSNRGDILVSLNRRDHPPEWMIWPTARGKNGARQRLNIDEIQSSLTLFRDLTDERMAVGTIKDKEKERPVLWRPGEELQLLAEGPGRMLQGEYKSINANNQFAGYFQAEQGVVPAVWSCHEGPIWMRNFRARPLPDGKAELADMLIAEDGTVYGTYRIEYDDGSKSSDYYAYAWLAYQGGGFKLLDLEGMRLSDLNDWHSLVGSWQGQAALCEPGQRPVKIAEIISKADTKNWELIEATSINNWGNIVGYGKLNGSMHLFLAQRLRHLGTE